MDSRLIVIAAISVVALILAGFFLGVFTPLVEFIIVFGFTNFILLFLIIAVLVGITLNFEGVWKLIGVAGLMVIAFIFLFIPNFVITYGFASLFSFGFVGFFVVIIILDMLSPPYPTIELILMIPLKKYFGVPFWLGEVISIGLALIGLLIVAIFYSSIWDILIQNFVFTPFHIVGFVAYFIIVVFVFDKLVESILGD